MMKKVHFIFLYARVVVHKAQTVGGFEHGKAVTFDRHCWETGGGTWSGFQRLSRSLYTMSRQQVV